MNSNDSANLVFIEVAIDQIRRECGPDDPRLQMIALIDETLIELRADITEATRAMDEGREPELCIRDLDGLGDLVRRIEAIVPKEESTRRVVELRETDDAA